MNKKIQSNTQRTSVVILAAGNSERMGEPKHSLLFTEGKTFLEHIISVYQRFGVTEIIIVVNENTNIFPEMFFKPEGIQIVMNEHLDLGRFHSVRLGLQYAKNDAFIQNVDNPFVNAGLLLELKKGIGNAEFAVPIYNKKGGHPILLSSKAVEKIKTDISEEKNLKEFLKSLDRKDVIVKDPYINVNINTPEDYLKYFSRRDY